jgi:small-conductance mechanosensitive channel
MIVQLLSVINSPVGGAALRIVLIGLLVFAASQGVRLAARHMKRRLEQTVKNTERLARLSTLVQAGHSATFVLILIVATLMVLYTLDINIVPLLAGASVAGLALSLGAQTLFKDYIGGILILVEDQFSVGDIVKVGDLVGSVERITLRATWLRDTEGKLVIVPNGDIRLVSNLTAAWAQAIVNLNVDYEADMHRVMRALESAAQKTQADETIRAALLEPPKALGWIGFNDWAVQVQLAAKTVPGKQWNVMIAMRKYAMEAFRIEGVRVALPAQHIRMEKEE